MTLLAKITLQKRVIFILTFLQPIAGLNYASAAAECPSLRWQPANTMPYFGLAYPEKNAQYWVFKFKNDPNAQLTLTLSAKFPYARYTAYTLYSLDNGDHKGCPVVYNGNIQHLADVDIKPLNGHRNPYLNFASRYEKNRSYKIHIVQEDSHRILPDGTPMANTLVIPADKEYLALFLRIYLPDNPRDPRGNVDLPIISAASELTGQTLPCPEGALKSEFVYYPYALIIGQWYLPFLRLPNDQIYSYRAGSFGLYANGDAPYLVVPLIPPSQNDNKIATLRFKAPRFPDTKGGETFMPRDQVRYWSVCIGDWKITNFSQCISDEDAKIDNEGFVNIVLGPKELTPAESKWNRIGWGTHANPVMLFRQISPRENFDNAFSKPEIAFDENTDWIDLRHILHYEPEKIAAITIGEFAPMGKYCTIDQFLQDNCGS